MARIETWLKCDLKQMVQVEKLNGNMFSADNGANRVGVIVTDGGESVTISEGVTGYVIRQDDATVVVIGSSSGNKVYIDLPASAYVVPGMISIVIKLGTTTVGACCGLVTRTSTDTIVDPGHVIPSIEELLAKIADCEAATTAALAATSSANTAATNANTKAGLADTAATNANTKAGLADTAATNANTKAGLANTAAGTANAAAQKINDMTVEASGLAAGASPTAQISEVSGHKHILFGIPKGDKGNTGQTPNLTIGAVTTVNPDQPAAATITGTSEQPVLNLSIPKGNTGSVDNVFGSTIPISESDNTSIKDTIGPVITEAEIHALF